MNQSKNRKNNIVLLIIFVALIFAAIWLLNRKENNKVVEAPSTNYKVESLCFYKNSKSAQNASNYDKSWLRLNILGSKVSGEFDNYPAGIDSKVGTFEGDILNNKEGQDIQTALVWWNSLAEGMKEKEQLLVKFNKESATVGFGQMVKQSDGSFIYKDKSNLTFQQQMKNISCTNLDKYIYVEKYIRENIKTIATNKPVLGGSWYVVNVEINPSSNTGTVVYEDGHIQSKANFSFVYDTSTQKTTIKDFKVTK